jgi:hypothetical protein
MVLIALWVVKLMSIESLIVSSLILKGQSLFIHGDQIHVCLGPINLQLVNLQPMEMVYFLI